VTHFRSFDFDLRPIDLVRDENVAANVLRQNKFTKGLAESDLKRKAQALHFARHTSRAAHQQWDVALRKTRSTSSREKELGFTLVELLVVVAILGLLIGLVAPAMIRQLGSAKHRIAEQSVARLAGILDIYRLDIGTYPSTDQGLSALNSSPAGAAGWNGPYLNDEMGIVDPWGRPFEYRSPSQRAGRAFDIASLGADGKPGGSGEDADILNR
jgi:general secretion pathway protein G